MGFRLNVPDVRLVIDGSLLPGGLEAWGAGELEVVVDGAIPLQEFFELAELAAGGEDLEQLRRLRDAFARFASHIKGWTIEEVAATPEGFMALPHHLALAIFRAWQGAARPDPTSSGA